MVPHPPRQPVQPRAKIQDIEGFKAFVDTHQDWPLKQFGDQFGVSFQTISKSLKRLGDTRKKNYGYAERDEERRRDFRRALTRYRRQGLIYLDETGMDERDRYDYGWSQREAAVLSLKPGSCRGRFIPIL